MASYIDNNNKVKRINLLKLGQWHIATQEEYDIEQYEETYEEMLDSGYVMLYMPNDITLNDCISNGDPSYPDFERRILLSFSYQKEDVLKFNPIAEAIYYPAYDEKDLFIQEAMLNLTQLEKKYFSTLLQQAIGDHHSPEMQQTMLSYYNEVDKEIYDFVNDVLHDRDVLPITIGYLSETQKNNIKDALSTRYPLECVHFASRCTLNADAVRHIIKRHGKNGAADQSMKDIKDIARMAFVLANFDSCSFDGRTSRKIKLADGSAAPHITFKKKINGTYYVIEAVTDAKSRKSHVVSAYIS